MSYRRRASPLHAAGAGAGVAYCAGLGVAALVLSSPLALGCVVMAVAAAGVLARVGREIRRALLLALPLAMAIALINALVTRDGLTVIARLGDLPILGHTDITLEATVSGAVLGLRAIALVLCGALYTAAIDPDQVLRLFRRVSFRSALTAALATRLVPVLVRDSRRLSEAQRCRPGPPPTRFQLLRATTSGVLDRALDVAAALEVRGYATAHRPSRVARARSRHDIAFTCSAIAVAGTAIVARAGGVVRFGAYPALHAPIGTATVAIAALLIACALLPFADTRGIAR